VRILNELGKGSGLILIIFRKPQDRIRPPIPQPGLGPVA